MIELSADIVAFLLVIGLIAGYVDSIAGGGGLLTIPALITAGLPVHLTLGTNKFAATLGIANAARIFIKKKIIKPRYWVAGIVATITGSLAGALMVQFIQAEFLYDVIPGVLFAVIVYVLWPKKYQVRSQQMKGAAPTFSSGALGLGLGAYDGFFGPGAGSFWVVLLMAWYKIDMITATAVAKLMNCLSNAVAMVIFMLFGNVDYRIGLMMGAAMIIGSTIGSHSAIKFGTRFVQPVFLIIVFTMAVKLALEFWF